MCPSGQTRGGRMGGLHDRVERGMAIAKASSQIQLVAENLWFVQSQSGTGGYLVGKGKGGSWTCNCPDYRSNLRPCKHLIGVRAREDGLGPVAAYREEARRPRPSYKQNWTTYNAAQNAELDLFDPVLHALLGAVQDPRAEATTGRPRFPLSDLLICAVEKVYYRRGFRVSKGLYEDLRRAGFIRRCPSQNLPGMALGREDVTPILLQAINDAAFPLAALESGFAVDSTGFRTTSFGDYCSEKYGSPVHNIWKKPHLLVGTATHVVVALVVTDGHVADSPQLPGLVKRAADAGFVMREVYADKGYLTIENYNAIGALGADPYIAFKENSRGHSQSGRQPSPFWKKAWHLFQADSAGFLKHYHKRSNVESVIGAIKKKHGETINAKNSVAQTNELLSKILAYNITVLIHEAFEHGIQLPIRGPPSPDLNDLPPGRPQSGSDLSNEEN